MALLDRLRKNEPKPAAAAAVAQGKPVKREIPAGRDAWYAELKSRVHNALFERLDLSKVGKVSQDQVTEDVVQATRMVLEGGGGVLVDERSLWPGGRFVTTHLVVRTRFLAEHPDRVAAVLRAHVRAVDFVNAEPARAKEIVNAALTRLVGKGLPAAVIDRSWEKLEFTVDPIAGSLRRSAEDAIDRLDEI